MDFQWTAPALISLRITSSFPPHIHTQRTRPSRELTDLTRRYCTNWMKSSDWINRLNSSILSSCIPSLCKCLSSVWWFWSMSSLWALSHWAHPRMSSLGVCCQISFVILCQESLLNLWSISLIRGLRFTFKKVGRYSYLQLERLFYLWRVLQNCSWCGCVKIKPTTFSLSPGLCENHGSSQVQLTLCSMCCVTRRSRRVSPLQQKGGEGRMKESDLVNVPGCTDFWNIPFLHCF